MKNKKIVIILLLAAVSLFLTICISVGYDYYWHISAGKYMVNNHTILAKDIFSWIMYNKTWISHEWLFEIIIYTLKLIFNNYSIIIYCFINNFILLLIIFMNNKNYNKNTIFTLLWLLLFIIINCNSNIPRPYLLSNNFLAITIYLLYDLLKNKDSKKIYMLPLITIIWSNVHGGSSNLSYIMVLIFILIGLVSKNKYTKDVLQIKKYLIVLVLCIIFININPHGFKILIYPYQNIINNVMISNITEWQSILKISPNNYIYFLFIIFISIIIIRNKEKTKLIDLSLLIIFIIMGIKSMRFSNYLYIVSSFFIFDYIKEKKDDNSTNLLLLISSIILIIIFIINIPNIEKKIIKEYIPNNMISKIKEVKPKRLFNLYDYGGYLINNNIKVFIDGRADLYSNCNYKDYINISNNINTEKLIDKYNFDYFLVDKNYSIYNYLKNNDYIKILDNGNIVLYKNKRYT